MEENKISVFLTNLKAYTEGNFVGEWVQLPCSREEMRGVFERTGLMDGAEWFLSEYDIAPELSNMQEAIGEYENLDELNFLAKRIKDMDGAEYEKFANIVSSGIKGEQTVESYINLTYNLDNFEVYPAMNDEEVGQMLWENMEKPEMEINDVDISAYIDFEAVGRDYAINEQCRYGISGLVHANGYMEEWFHGVPDGDRVIPDMPGTNEKSMVRNAADELER